MAHTNKIPNALIHETSPYLLQHAYNPVKWLPFGDEAFALAKKQGKPVLVSIGYSACHWCHVMEHESFEDAEVARVMNEHFINIKVDREERSDVDMIYMQAVQLMTGQGGWPLNCFVLADGRPFYGGTYFNKKQWLQALSAIHELHSAQYEKVEEYAAQLTEGIRQTELYFSESDESASVNREHLRISVAKWKARFDNKYGGPDKAPKFPLPNNYQFLLRYGILAGDQDVLKHVHLTLEAMARGGIYDQLHGGFARYSTDVLWKVPHFEKMLYDNAQLVSLYCEAWRHTPNPLYQKVVKETMEFVQREWMGTEGCFYSAYDADSEGVEGKFYVWSKTELRSLLGDDAELFFEYYHVDDLGYWEDDHYILMLNDQVAAIALKHQLTVGEADGKMEKCREQLREASKSRVKPGLDDKSITSWNAMMCSASARAYLTFGPEHYREMAMRSIDFILKRLMRADNGLYHTYKNGKAKINGFLDDYAFVTEALLSVYLITQDESYLHKAKAVTEKALESFKNPSGPMLFYTEEGSSKLITRGTEVQDNVIPASNSQMALNLFVLAQHFNRPEWSVLSLKMLGVVEKELQHYGGGYSNWACLALLEAWPLRQLAIVGKNVNEKLLSLHQHSLTNTILAVSRGASELALIKERYVDGETLIYVCENNSCRLPVSEPEEALKQL